jgi:hypothetical protein
MSAYEWREVARMIEQWFAEIGEAADELLRGEW